MFLTYELHSQHYGNYIERLVQRDIDLKLIRFTRFILTFHSRGIYREEIKIALRSGNIETRLKVFKKIKISEITEEQLLKKKVTRKDYLKTCAFQFGQVLGLLYDKEFYTKESISKKYKNLSDFLFRKESEEKILDDVFQNICSLLEQNLKNMKL